MKVLKIIDSFLNFIVFTFFVIALSFSFYALYDVHAVYENTELSGDILKYKPSIQGENSFGDKFSVADLKNINEDIVGWIRVDDTNIDYPILAGVDNTDYLKKDYQGNYSPSGSIFLDYRNSRDLDDDFFVIYGHNMSRGLMFSDIKKYQEKKFFDAHSTGNLYTEMGVFDLKMISYSIVNANKSIAYKLLKYKKDNNSELVTTLMSEAIQKSSDVFETNRLILLSTCYGVGTYDRSVLLASVTESDSSTYIKNQNEQNNIQNEIDKNIVEKNKKDSLLGRSIILIIYILILGIVYFHTSIRHIQKKRKNLEKIS